MEHTSKGVVLTTSNKNKIQTKKLIYASGYESIKYIDKKIVNLHSKYAVCSEQGRVTQVPFKRKALLWNTAHSYLHIRNTFDKRIPIGGRDETFFNQKKQMNYLLKNLMRL
ncbi:MAG: hypothetical protein ACKVOM_07535 [Ferruginibacter sp.]